MQKKDIPFLTPQIQNVIQILEGQVFFVGGTVRDFLLSRPICDIDMATPILPTKSVPLLEKAGYKIIPSGLTYGTITILTNPMPIQLTTFRTDDKTDGRHAQVSFSTQMHQDAMRRDFTFNALYMDANGHIFDFFHGINDLRKNRLRFIGNPYLRIQEDYLRILRFFRFWGLLGKTRPPLNGLKACHQMRFGLSQLSKERQRDEFFKILALPQAERVLFFMNKAGISKVLFGEDLNLRPLRQLIRVERKLGTLPHILVRLHALFPNRIPTLALSNKQKLFLKRIHQSLNTPLTPIEQRKIAYFYGKDILMSAVLILGSKQKNYIPFPVWSKIEKLNIPPCPIKAKDIQEKWGYQGHNLGNFLRQAQIKWIEMNCPSKKELVLEKLQ